jgi:hypothetical protein
MTALIYTGTAAIPGVPARDLTAEEVKEHGKERLLKSGLYEEPKKETAKKDGKK